MKIKKYFGPVGRLGNLPSRSTTALTQKDKDPINKLIFIQGGNASVLSRLNSFIKLTLTSIRFVTAVVCKLHVEADK